MGQIRASPRLLGLRVTYEIHHSLGTREELEPSDFRGVYKYILWRSAYNLDLEMSYFTSGKGAKYEVLIIEV
jgi:hypothetical protein